MPTSHKRRGMSNRIKLIVTEVKEVQKVGEKQIPKLNFKAKDPEGKEHQYFSFRTSLFELIKSNAELDAEVDITTREYDGTTYTDRKITQIYVDGQPVGGQKKPWGKSPEMILVELDARAKNTSLMSACELAKVDKIDIKTITKTAQEFYEWLKDDLTSKPTSQKSTSSATPDKDWDKISSNSETPEKVIDQDWLKKSLETLYSKQPQVWADTVLLSYMKTTYKVKGGTSLEAAAKLTKEQAIHFTKKIQEALDYWIQHSWNK